MKCSSEDAGISNQMKQGMRKLFILFSLYQKESHGYELLKRFKEKISSCGGKISAGEFYASLESLNAAGLISAEWKTNGKKPRKIFRLTEKGKVVLRKAKKQFEKTMSDFRKIVPEIFGDKNG